MSRPIPTPSAETVTPLTRDAVVAVAVLRGFTHVRCYETSVRLLDWRPSEVAGVRYHLDEDDRIHEVDPLGRIQHLGGIFPLEVRDLELTNEGRRICAECGQPAVSR